MRLIDADKLYRKFGVYTEKASMEYAKARNENERMVWDCIKDECSKAMWMIRNEPTVNRWIPVSERLPKIGEKVLGSFITECYKGDRKYVDHGVAITKRCGNESWYGFLDDEIVAWMELPEPYHSMGENYGFATKEEADIWMNGSPVGKEEI